jgi:hypothetical protein
MTTTREPRFVIINGISTKKRGVHAWSVSSHYGIGYRRFTDRALAETYAAQLAAA